MFKLLITRGKIIVKQDYCEYSGENLLLWWCPCVWGKLCKMLCMGWTMLHAMCKVDLPGWLIVTGESIQGWGEDKAVTSTAPVLHLYIHTTTRTVPHTEMEKWLRWLLWSHWLHLRWSPWPPQVQPVTTKQSTWPPFHFSTSPLAVGLVNTGALDVWFKELWSTLMCIKRP